MDLNPNNLIESMIPPNLGMTGQQFQERLKRQITTEPQETGGWPEAPLAYDAVWSVLWMRGRENDDI
jgi:hypothetical protein